jgi:hypothetical protein
MTNAIGLNYLDMLPGANFILFFINFSLVSRRRSPGLQVGDGKRLKAAPKGCWRRPRG